MLVLVMRIELLLAMQSADGQTQPLCPTQLFQYIESECGPVDGLDGIEPLLAPSGVPTWRKLKQCQLPLCCILTQKTCS